MKKTLLARWLRRLVAGFALLNAYGLPHAQPAAADPFAADARALVAVETLATLPPGNFLENLWVDADGSLLITSYLAREVLRYRPGTGLAVELRLEGHPVSIAADTDGTRYMVVHGNSFRQGAQMLASQQIWRITGSSATLFMEVPDARFLNGIAWLGSGRFLIADSLAGVLWVLDVQRKTMRPWLRHEDLQSALPDRFVPGANGVNIVGNEVWISNSSKRLLMTVALGADGSAGAVRRRAEGIPIDDFAVAEDGTVYAATHNRAVLRLRPDGTRAVVAETPEVNDSTSLRFGRGNDDRDKLYLITSGGAFAGRSEPVALSRLSVGQRAAPLRAPKLTMSNSDVRTVLNYRVRPEAAQAWLPSPWLVNPAAAGASAGANLALIFIDRLHAQDAEGRPTPDALERSLVLTVPARHSASGELVTFPVRAYTNAASQVPGPYQNSQRAEFSRRLEVASTADSVAVQTERWEVRPASGGSVDMLLRATTGIPGKLTAQATLRSPVDPALSRTYRIDQGLDMVRSAAPGTMDRLQALSLRVDIPDLRDVLDGTEQLVSAGLAPWYLRQVYVP